MDIFVKRINKLIEENKITKYKLAKEIGANKQSVIWWCNGTNEPKISSLYKIAVYFDVSADYLIGLEDEAGGKILTNKMQSINEIHNEGGIISNSFNNK